MGSQRVSCYLTIKAQQMRYWSHSDPGYSSFTGFIRNLVWNRFVVAKVGGWIEWEFGISRCKLLHTEWINNKVQLYSTVNILG